MIIVRGIYMEITDSHATFEINIIGQSTKQTYLGEFKVICLLSPMSVLEADKLYRTLLGAEGSLYASERAKNLAFALSQLKYRVVSSPPFWDNRKLGGSHIPDDNVIIEIINLAIEAEEKYLQEKEEEAEKLQERLKEAFDTKVIEKEEEELINEG